MHYRIFQPLVFCLNKRFTQGAERGEIRHWIVSIETSWRSTKGESVLALCFFVVNCEEAKIFVGPFQVLYRSCHNPL